MRASQRGGLGFLPPGSVLERESRRYSQPLLLPTLFSALQSPMYRWVLCKTPSIGKGPGQMTCVVEGKLCMGQRNEESPLEGRCGLPGPW